MLSDLLLMASGPLFAQSALKTLPRVPQIPPLDDSGTGFALNDLIRIR
jgi:hypothetical protein